MCTKIKFCLRDECHGNNLATILISRYSQKNYKSGTANERQNKTTKKREKKPNQITKKLIFQFDFCFRLLIKRH